MGMTAVEAVIHGRAAVNGRRCLSYGMYMHRLTTFAEPTVQRPTVQDLSRLSQW